MSDATTSAPKVSAGWLRFGRLVAIAAGCLALLGLSYAPMAFVPAALLAAVIAIVAGLATRDPYPLVGGAISAMLALGSPAGWTLILTVHQQYLNAESKKAESIVAMVEEMAEFEAQIRAYQPDIRGIDRQAVVYERITTTMKYQLQQHKSFENNSSAQYQIYSQMVSAKNQTDAAHNEITDTTSSFQSRLAAAQAKWARIQGLCASAQIANSRSCSDVRNAFANYSKKTADVRAALGREQAAYSTESAEQQQIMDSVD